MQNFFTHFSLIYKFINYSLCYTDLALILTKFLLKNKIEPKKFVLLIFIVLANRASVEIKPILYTGENVDTPTDVIKQELSIGQTFWGFHHEKWHDSCIQKCIVYERICSAVVSVTQEIAAKICYEIKNAAYDPQSRVVSEAGIGRIAEFCIYVIDQVLIENIFSWGDVLVSFSLPVAHSFLFPLCYLLSLIFSLPLRIFSSSMT